MDPATIIGLIAAIQQLLGNLFKYGQSVYNAKTEINQLCSELLALKAALEHIQLNITYDRNYQTDMTGDKQSTLLTPMLTSPEFKTTLSMTEAILTELLPKLDMKPGRFRSSLQRLTWPLEDITSYVGRLERLKGWFILATTSDNIQICMKSYTKLCSIERQLQYQGDLQEQHQNDKHRRSVRKWLAPYDPYQSFESSIAAFQEGTGEWFLNGSFQVWLAEQGPPILWLRAKPGAGKTTLLSAAIKRFQLSETLPDSETGLVYFFCSFTDQQSQDPQNIFGSVLAQLYDAHPQLRKDIDERYYNEVEQSHQQEKKLAMNDIEDLIVYFSKQLSGIFLFLDAINETKQPSKICQSLINIVTRGARVRIMMSSTEELGAVLNSPLISIIQMKSEDIDGDIKDYIKVSLQLSEDLSELPAAIKHDIQAVLERKACGMFRFVQCQLQNLVNQKTIQEIRAALQNIPSTLGQTYENILSRISKDEILRAKQTLFWLTFSMYSMTFEELCEAIIIHDDDPVINDEVRLLQRAREALLQTCGSMISYDTTTKRITLAHSTVRSYLISQDIQTSHAHEFYLDQATADGTIVAKSIKYLCLPAFRSGYCTSGAALEQRFDDWPLLRYIANSLFEHLAYVTLDESTRSLLLHFFSTHTLPRGGNFGAWVQAFFPISHENIESSTPLYYASRYGLLPVVRLILEIEGTKSLEVPGGMYGSTPLHVATWKGRIDVVEALLEAGANAKEVNQDGKPGLLWAVKYGFRTIERMLREAGATLDDKIVKYGFRDEEQMLKFAGENWEELGGTLSPVELLMKET
ncbi:hypothetical protein MMC11_006278 [Xylographa trunciseda]|nr:hypothetical protein [Xylographa trunciseda]